MKSAASQLVVCIHYRLGTGNINLHTDSQDAISNHLIYTYHIQELAKLVHTYSTVYHAVIQKQPTIERGTESNHSIIVGRTERCTLIVVDSYPKHSQRLAS